MKIFQIDYFLSSIVIVSHSFTFNLFLFFPNAFVLVSIEVYELKVSVIKLSNFGIVLINKGLHR
jgi:hypothetical protein